MPVNLDFGNDMVAAYSRGSQEREEQVKRLQNAADKQVELKQHQQQLDQEAEHYKNLIDLSRSSQALEATKAAQGAQLQQAETGQTPAGYNPVYIPNAQDPSKMDVQQYVNPQNPVASRFLPVDPAVMAQRTQQQLVPKTDEQIRRDKALQDAEQVKALAVAVQHGVDQERIRKEQEVSNEKIQSAHDAARLKAAGIRANIAKSAGLNANGINTIAGQYEKDPVMKQAADLAENVADVSRIDINSNNPNVDQKLIFGAGRLVNPAIGVRGYEYSALRDNAQSIADTVGIKLSNFFDKHESLTPEARQKLKEFILENSQGKLDAADLQRNNYITRLKALAPDLPDAKVQALIGPGLHTTLLEGTGYKPVRAGGATTISGTDKEGYKNIPVGATYFIQGDPTPYVKKLGGK